VPYPGYQSDQQLLDAAKSLATQSQAGARADLASQRAQTLAAPKILAARTGKDARGELSGRPCFAGPVALLGRYPWVTGEWSTGSTVRDEFNLVNLPMLEADEDRAAGFVRIRELLCSNPEHKFPEWHERAGEEGAPRLFLKGCPRLIEQLQSAPLEADDEPLLRTAVSQRWEAAGGGLVAALRYAVLSRPSPSEAPKEWIEDMRTRAITSLIDKQNNPRPPVPSIDYTWSPGLTTEGSKRMSETFEETGLEEPGFDELDPGYDPGQEGGAGRPAGVRGKSRSRRKGDRWGGPVLGGICLSGPPGAPHGPPQ